MQPVSVYRSRVRPAVAVILLAVCAFAFSGCGGGGVAGKYMYKMNAPGSPGGSITLELKSNNKAMVTIRGAGPNEVLPSNEGTWKQEGDKITTVIDGHADVYTLTKDGNLSGTAFGERLVFQKQ